MDPLNERERKLCRVGSLDRSDKDDPVPLLDDSKEAGEQMSSQKQGVEVADLEHQEVSNKPRIDIEELKRYQRLKNKSHERCSLTRTNINRKIADKQQELEVLERDVQTTKERYDEVEPV